MFLALTAGEAAPTLGRMRWDALFTDMEAQFAEDGKLAIESEISERARVEVAGVALADRLRGGLGSQVFVRLLGGRTFEGKLSHAGADALLLDESRHQVLVPYAAVAHYSGLVMASLPEASQVRRRIGLAHALRTLARDRAAVTILLRYATGSDSAFTGVIDRVGSDFLDLAMVGPGEARRAARVREVATIPFESLGALRSRHPGDM